MIKGLIFDLDGTLYRGEEEVPGASHFVVKTNECGVRSLFVTNRSNRAPRVIGEQLRRYGIPNEDSDILTSSQATALFLEKGSAYVIGEYHLCEALEQEGFTIADQAVDYVVVGFDRGFNYEKMATATRLIGEGARFIACNPDAYLQMPGGRRSPGTGAMVAAIQVAAGVAPIVVGKPERTIVDMSLARLGMDKDDVVMIGDNLNTDIAAGARCGLRTALLLTGVSSRLEIQGAEYKPTWVSEDYEQLWNALSPEFSIR